MLIVLLVDYNVNYDICNNLYAVVTFEIVSILYTSFVPRSRKSGLFRGAPSVASQTWWGELVHFPSCRVPLTCAVFPSIPLLSFHIKSIW